MLKALPLKLLLYILIGGAIVTVIFLTHPLGSNNYGYDYGFYSYAVIHTPLDSPAYFIGQVNDYGNHLFVILNWLRLPQLPTLHILFVLFFIVSGILFYELVKKFGKWPAFTAIALFTLSIAQSQANTMFLWKAAYGQLLLLTIFLLIEFKKNLFWQSIPLVFLFITHKTTSIIALLALTPYYVFSPFKKKALILVGLAVAGVIFLFGLNGFNYIQQLLNSNVQNGLFLSLVEYLKYSWYLIPGAAWGVYISLKSKTNLVWLGLLITCVVFIIFQLTFHQRLLLYADLGLIYFNALALSTLKTTHNYHKYLSVLIVIIALFSFIQFTKDYTVPQISEAEITEIQKFSALNQGAFVLALSAQDATWLLANLNGNIRLASPGLFEDKYSLTSWQNFWSNPKDQIFLNGFPTPLYLYQKSTIFYPEQQSQPWECLQKISDHFYKYTCSK